VSYLIHRLYTPTDEILRNYDAQCLRTGLKLDFKWDGPSQPPEFTDDQEVAVVLDRRFKSLEMEMVFTSIWLLEQGLMNGWSAKFERDSEQLWLQGNVPYIGGCQRWVRIRRTTNYRKSPESVIRHGRSTPGPQLLTMLAQHPMILRNMNGSPDHPYFIASGLVCKLVQDECLRAPLLWVNERQQLQVSAADLNSIQRDCSVPEFV
jgi:hypothetical protein